MQRNWKIKKQGNFEQKTNGNLLAGFQYELPQCTNVLMRKEAKFDIVIHYIAEVGGYLGLLLGESIISYLIIASKWFQILGRKLKERSR